MKWALLQSTHQFRYWKLEDESFSAELKYNKDAQSFRIASKDKRLFFLERTGFLHQKFLLRTEYSVIAGEVLPIKNRRSGIAVYENKKYSFLVKDDLLIVSDKKQDYSTVTRLADHIELGGPEFYALVFGTLKVLAGVHQINPISLQLIHLSGRY